MYANLEEAVFVKELKISHQSFSESKTSDKVILVAPNETI
jgi:hypothetical protein